MPITLLRILFHDLCNQPMPNLYHEIRENGRTISAGNSDGEGYGVWMRRQVGRALDIAVKDPKTGAMTTLPTRIIVQKPKTSNAHIVRVQAPYFTQLISLQPRQGTQGDYLRKPHTVKKGETLEGIAKQYNTTSQILHRLNKDKIKDPNKIQVGWVLKVPPKSSGLRGSGTSTKTQPTKSSQINPNTKPKITTSNYQVEKGDTLGSIAQRSGKSISDLQRLNGITDPNKIRAGQYIKTGLPDTPKPTSSTTKPSSQSVPTQASSSSRQDGGILNRVQEAAGDGAEWLGQQASSLGQAISSSAGQIADSVSGTVSGWFGEDGKTEGTPEQKQANEIKPSIPEPITPVINQTGNRAGNGKVVVERPKSPIIFPLIEQPLNDPGKSYANFDWRRKLGEEGAGQTVFNWNRDGGRRKHAGRDLYTRAQNADASAKPGSVVVSIAPGKILDVREFYYKTDAVTISHTTEDGRKFIVRYGELAPESVKHLKQRIGKPIQQGEILGVTGVLIKNGSPVRIANDKNISMLHFECFTGEGHSLDRADNLYNSNNIYQRRTDLADPLEILLEGYRATFIKPIPNVSKKTDIPIGEIRVRAFMQMLRVGEGTVGDIGYETLFGGKSFIKDFGRDFSDHPRIHRPFGKTTSTAAGAYQVMGYTWDDAKMIARRKQYNIRSFSKIDQDLFCVILLKYKRSGGWTLLLQGQIREALEKFYSYEWASLPPGRYGQPSKTMVQALKIYGDYFDKENQGITDLQLKYGFLKEIFNV